MSDVQFTGGVNLAFMPSKKMNKIGNVILREEGFCQWQPLYIDSFQCSKANLALLNI